MSTARSLQCSITALLTFTIATPAGSQEVAKAWQGGHGRFLWALSEDDTVMPVTSVEWGSPDRLSLTSRYVHLFTKDRNARPLKPWIHGASVTLSPGTGGGRFGVGYQGVWRIGKVPILPEARLVLLRTWGNPLQTGPNRTFAGAEVRCSLVGVANAGAGWYRRISGLDGRGESFWGFHVGLGM